MWFEVVRAYTIQEGVWSVYTFSKILGEGSFGKVFLAERKAEPHDLVAIKILDVRRIIARPQNLK